MIRSHIGELINTEEDIKLLRTILKERKDIQFMDFRKRALKYVTRLDKTAIKIQRTNVSKLKKEQLVNLIQEYFETARRAQNFLLPMIPIDRELSNRILSLLPNAAEETKQEWLRILTFPKKENEHTKEERSFYNLVKNYKKRSFKKLLKKHLKEFSWIGARGYSWDNEWTEKEIVDRIEFFLKQGRNPKKELLELDKIRKDMGKKMKKLVKHLDIKKNSRLHKLTMIAKEYAFLRTWRTDKIYGAGYKAKNLFSEIAKRANMNRNDLKYLTYEEVFKTAKDSKSPITKAELERRKECSVLITFDNKQIVLSGKKAGEEISKLFKQKKKKKTIKGISVFKGKVKGTAKIVISSEQISKVKEGDILIAAMTHPNYVPAMEKAAAFVTDEGGILCHASIIARELKKPCIISTKIATQNFKDGDMIEVDANKGIVKKIK
ncbi:hypothetical protein HQ533_05015 [Candidatus Woesearchaeota archaeon]|nr:hypothetical protein [Candidatus Woesearchaeota archaeon]